MPPLKKPAAGSVTVPINPIPGPTTPTIVTPYEPPINITPVVPTVPIVPITPIVTTTPTITTAPTVVVAPIGPPSGPSLPPTEPSPAIVSPSLAQPIFVEPPTVLPPAPIQVLPIVNPPPPIVLAPIVIPQPTTPTPTYQEPVIVVQNVSTQTVATPTVTTPVVLAPTIITLDVIPPSSASPTTVVTTASPTPLPTPPPDAVVPTVSSPATVTSNEPICVVCALPQNPNAGTPTTPTTLSTTTVLTNVVAPEKNTPAPAAPLAAPTVPQPTPLVPNSVQCTTTLNVLGEGISFSQTVKQYKVGASQQVTATVKLFNTNQILQALSTGKSQPLDLTQVLQVYASNNGKATAGLVPNILPIFTQAAISALTAGQELLAGNLDGAGEKLIKPFCDAKLPTAQNALLTAIGIAGAQKSLTGRGISLSPEQSQIMATAINSNNSQQMPQGNYFRATLPFPVLQINQSKSNAPAHYGPKKTPAKVTKTGGAGFGIGTEVSAGVNVGKIHVSAKATVETPISKFDPKIRGQFGLGIGKFNLTFDPISKIVQGGISFTF